MVFSRTYCACPQADPAQRALLTSKFPHAAAATDEVPGRLNPLTPDAAIKAFEKAPFAVQVSLASRGGPGMGIFHLRGNVPSEMEPQARGDVANFYGGRKNDDSALGEILGALDRMNAAKDTVVCFTSDCGQQLGSHGLDGNGVPFEESVRVPLAIRYPAKLKPLARDLASQVDIMPTLLALCGMEVPDGVQGQNLFGKTPPELAYAEGKLGENDEWRMLVRGYDKLTATPKGEVTHLFNLAEDPYARDGQSGARFRGEAKARIAESAVAGDDEEARRRRGSFRGCGGR